MASGVLPKSTSAYRHTFCQILYCNLASAHTAINSLLVLIVPLLYTVSKSYCITSFLRL